MKERPILFSAPMVQAILAGNKTQTRRIVKPAHELWIENSTKNFLDGNWEQRPFPYGRPGDQLWVRETHAIVPRTAYRCSEGVDQILKPNDDHDAAIFRADWCRSMGGLRWKPSIHMPRWASRIQLEITNIRVERLNDCSDADAIEEGIDRTNTSIPGYAKARYEQLWESINGIGSWNANPWVWVIEFRRIERNQS